MGDFFKAALLPLLIFCCFFSVWAQTFSVEKFLLTGQSQDSGSAILIKSSEKKIKNILEEHKVKYYRQIADDFYIVVSNDRLSKEKIDIIGFVNNKWKVNHELENKISFPLKVVSEVLKVEDLKSFCQANKIPILKTHTKSNTALLEIDNHEKWQAIINNENVVYLKRYHQPYTETPNSFQDLAVNRINYAHHVYPEITGEGLVFSLKERAIDTTDIDLKNRYINTSLSDEVISLHANQMATIIAGGGNTHPTSKGIAWKAKVLSSSFQNLLPDDEAFLTNYNVSLQNHSYGTSIENYYGPEAKAYDDEAISNPAFLHVYSAGNAGLQVSDNGIYKDIPGYANMTGNMKMAKNVLVVGGHNKLFSTDERNSNGPAYDGRIKPEVVAFGPEGTSDAAAFASGVCLLLQDAYLKKTTNLPAIDLIKAILISTADDQGTPGIDHKSGYGAINAKKALEVLSKDQFWQSSVTNGSYKEHVINIPFGVKRVSIALNWIDPSVPAGSLKALVNDLDLQVISNNNVWLPYVLSTYPHPDSLALPAKRKADHLNNTEYIVIENPEAGNYLIRVNGYEVNNSQNFSVAYSLEKENSFVWTYPTSSDKMLTGEDYILRWDTSLEGAATLEVSYNAGDFVEVASIEDISSGQAVFTPESSGITILQIKQGNTVVTTDVFIVSEQALLNVGFMCDDSFMINWNKNKNATGYRVYQLGQQYMETFMITTDTSLIMNNTGQKYFAVEPMFGGRSGYRSAGYNIQTQGVHCYYTLFYANAGENIGHLNLQLSTTYNIDKIIWLRQTEGEFQEIGQSVNVNNELQSFSDNDLKSGITRYKARIILLSGEPIETDIATLYYANESSYVVFPNPVNAASEDVGIISDANDISVCFYDTSGRLVKTQSVLSSYFKFPLNELTPGLYLYKILKGNSFAKGGRLLVK